jgi:hypothetical protein
LGRRLGWYQRRSASSEEEKILSLPGKGTFVVDGFKHWPRPFTAKIYWTGKKYGGGGKLGNFKEYEGTVGLTAIAHVPQKHLCRRMLEQIIDTHA